MLYEKQGMTFVSFADSKGGTIFDLPLELYLFFVEKTSTLVQLEAALHVWKKNQKGFELEFTEYQKVRKANA